MKLFDMLTANAKRYKNSIDDVNKLAMQDALHEMNKSQAVIKMGGEDFILNGGAAITMKNGSPYLDLVLDALDGTKKVDVGAKFNNWNTSRKDIPDIERQYNEMKAFLSYGTDISIGEEITDEMFDAFSTNKRKNMSNNAYETTTNHPGVVLGRKFNTGTNAVHIDDKDTSIVKRRKGAASVKDASPMVGASLDQYMQGHINTTGELITSPWAKTSKPKTSKPKIDTPPTKPINDFDIDAHALEMEAHYKQQYKNRLKEESFQRRVSNDYNYIENRKAFEKAESVLGEYVNGGVISSQQDLDDILGVLKNEHNLTNKQIKDLNNRNYDFRNTNPTPDVTAPNPEPIVIPESEPEIINPKPKPNPKPEPEVVIDTPETNIETVNPKAGKTYRFSPSQEATGKATFLRAKLNDDGSIINKRNNEVIRAANKTIQEGTEEVGNKHLKAALSGRNLNALVNLGFAFSDYNEARNSGDGVLKAGVKAGAQFVAGEMLGGWMMPVMLAKQLPSMAVNTIEATQNMTRKMNSTARVQTFGEAQFQDTQQLATMRQAGMEMARMSQYNLQQSIMGNEAQYMHRL